MDNLDIPLRFLANAPPVPDAAPADPVLELPEALDVRERRVIAQVQTWIEKARQHRATWGTEAGIDLEQLQGLRAELETLVTALRAELPRRVAARDEAIGAGGRTLLSIDDDLREYKLRLERALVLHRRVDAQLRSATAAGSGR